MITAMAHAARRAFAGVRWATVAAFSWITTGAAKLGRNTSAAFTSGWAASQRRVPVLARVPRQVAAACALTIAALAAFGLGMLGARHLPAMGINPLALVPGVGKTVIEGRAAAVSGDALRIDGKLIKLAGVEAPELEQRCGNRRTAWRCGAAAHSGLRDLVRNRPVRCEAGGPDASGRMVATCTAGGRDLAGEQAAKGLAFAEEGLFSRYGAREKEAREAKLGVWRVANAERPKAYRDRRWEVAQKAAPQGCPIKGHVVGNDRVYVLPWSPQYERVRVREQRGGRWFCSETEARAAGWRPIERS